MDKVFFKRSFDVHKDKSDFYTGKMFDKKYFCISRTWKLILSFSESHVLFDFRVIFLLFILFPRFTYKAKKVFFIRTFKKHPFVFNSFVFRQIRYM
jgi:hypothetical protein